VRICHCTVTGVAGRSMPDQVCFLERGDVLTDDRDALAKLEVILGSEGVRKLSSSTVLVLGLGGVGSNCVEALARGGIGRFVIIDGDVVQASNINRQAIAFHSTIGRRKVDVTREMITDINPSAQVTAIDDFVLKEQVGALLDPYCGKVDYVIDAIDTVSTKLALAEYADRRGMRFISSMGAANKLHPELLRFADIYDTATCPLCRIIRKEARKRHIKNLRVLYSCEKPVRTVRPLEADRHDRADLGTASFMPAIMGMMIAGEVIRFLSGVEEADRSASGLPYTHAPVCKTAGIEE